MIHSIQEQRLHRLPGSGCRSAPSAAIVNKEEKIGLALAKKHAGDEPESIQIGIAKRFLPIEKYIKGFCGRLLS